VLTTPYAPSLRSAHPPLLARRGIRSSHTFQRPHQEVVKNDLSSASVSSGTSSAIKWPLRRDLPFASTAFCLQKSMALRKAGGRFPRSAHKDRTGHALFLFQSASSISRSMPALAR